MQREKIHRLQVFRSKWFAKEYFKLQGWTMREAKSCMFKWPRHKWANKFGRVVVIKRDFGVSGWKHLFETGDWEYISQHGKELYDWE